MKNIYTLCDIQEFLTTKLNKNCKWNFEIYERSSGKKRQAKIEDFTENDFETLALAFVYKNEEYSLDVAVTNFKFKIYDDTPNIMGSGSTTTLRNDFTQNWVDFLLDRYKKDYAKLLVSYAERNIKSVNDKAEEKIKKFIGKVKKEVRVVSSYYENLSKNARKFLVLDEGETE